MKQLVRPAALLCAAALALALAGCGSAAVSRTSESSAADQSYAAAGSTANAAPGESGPAAGLGANSSAATAETGRKIVYNATLDLESTGFSAAQTALLAAVDAAGGYVESSSLNGSAENQNRQVYYSVRIPAEGYRAFLAAAGQVGSVLSQSENAQDITSSYIDVEARLTALRAQRDRLNALAEKAETTADLLEIESQLSDVQYQLESYTQQLRAMSDQVSYSTVALTLNEVAALSPTGSGFTARLANAFTGGWRAFSAFLQNAAVALVYLLPVLLLAALGTGLGFAFARRCKKRAPAKPARPAGPAGPAQYDPAPRDRPQDPAPKA